MTKPAFRLFGWILCRACNRWRRPFRSMYGEDRYYCAGCRADIMIRGALADVQWRAMFDACASLARSCASMHEARYAAKLARRLARDRMPTVKSGDDQRTTSETETDASAGKSAS